MSDQSQYKSIITAREIQVVREYISLSKRLRADYDRMKGGYAFTRLSSQCGLTTTLDEQGVNDLISSVVTHAGMWPGIEFDMRVLCEEVFIYSERFTTATTVVVGYIKSLPGYASASAALSALPEEAWEGQVIPLGETDFMIVPSIKMVINTMSEEITTLKAAGDRLISCVFNFKQELMNTIQTALRKITRLDTIHELEEELSRISMSEDDRLTVRGHMHNVTSAFAEVVKQSYLRDNKIPNVNLINFHKDDYERILQGLPSASAANITALVLRMRSGAVLTQHFSDFHNAVERLDVSLESADKGIGQLRTLWTISLNVLQGAQDRTLQVTSLAKIKRIEKSLGSAAEQWLSARKNAEELDTLLRTPY
jgi:hypothetical protein